MKQAWRELTEDERMSFSLLRLREQTALLKRQWTESKEAVDVSQSDLSDVISEIG